MKAWQINVADMMFRGMKDEDICVQQFGIDREDKDALAKGKRKLSNLRRNEKFQEYYKTIITEWTVHNVGKALVTIAEQMDDTNPWIRNKAANDILNQSKNFTGIDNNAVVLKVESGIELGTPEG